MKRETSVPAPLQDMDRCVRLTIVATEPISYTSPFMSANTLSNQNKGSENPQFIEKKSAKKNKTRY